MPINRSEVRISGAIQRSFPFDSATSMNSCPLPRCRHQVYIHSNDMYMLLLGLSSKRLSQSFLRFKKPSSLVISRICIEFDYRCWILDSSYRSRLDIRYWILDHHREARNLICLSPKYLVLLIWIDRDWDYDTRFFVL